MKIACVLVVAGAATMIFSQSACPSESDASTGATPPGQLEEIIVTAQKREETLLKVPVAVSVLSQTQLNDQGVVGLGDLTSSVPDLVMKTIGITDGIEVQIRGITNGDINESGNPAAATYIDGFYIGRTEGLEGALYDLQRIEVLRGPQGTLYGRNSTGGNVNIISADPQPSLGGAADISYGDYSDLLVHGMVNIPVSDTLAIRAAVMMHQSNGFYDTLGSTQRGYGEADDHAGRVTILWKPMDSFQWRLSVDDFVSNGTPNTSIAIGPNGKPLNGLPILDQPTLDHFEPYNHLNNAVIRSKMDWQIDGHWSLAYVAGYQDLKFAAQVGIGPNLDDSLRRDPFHSYSHELDLNFDSEALKNTVGATYFNQSTSSPDAYHFLTLGLSYGLPQPDRVLTDAWGIFDQATYSVNDSLRVIAGLRYSSETQHALGAISTFCPLDVFPTAPLSALATLFGPGCFHSTVIPAGGTWSNVNWKAGLEYDLSNHTSSYLSATTGFKSGGANIGFQKPVPNFEPEKVINYEFGVKTRLLDGRLNLNTALFYENYTNLQVTQIVQFDTITENAADAHIYGMENEGQWRVTKHDQISGFLTYLHATYEKYPDALDQYTGQIVPSLAGNHLPSTPIISLRFQYLHDFDLPDGGTLTPSVSAYWQSASYLTPFNTALDRVDAYSKTDGILTYTDPSRHWKLQGYVYNLENKLIPNNGGAGAVGQYTVEYGAPRTYGVRLSYQY
jgi:iron complex outermembrane recepter protein